MQTLSSIGLTDLLVTVLERTQPGLAQAMKDLAKERSEAKPVDDKPGVVTEPGQAGDAAQT
jgi:hypothetical protein